MDNILQLTNYFLLAISISPCRSQISEMRPDVTFDDRNERFDISRLVQLQNRYYDREEAKQMENFRRNVPNMNLLAEELRKNVRNNKDFSQFAYHDQMDSEEGGDVGDFNKNLINFRNSRRFENILNSLLSKKTRRSGTQSDDLEKDALLHYAVPIDMKIQGYLQAPLDD